MSRHALLLHLLSACGREGRARNVCQVLPLVSCFIVSLEVLAGFYDVCRSSTAPHRNVSVSMDSSVIHCAFVLESSLLRISMSLCYKS